DSCEPPWPVKVVISRDPNDKVGPIGVGDARWVRGDAPLAWWVQFENMATATAPAQRIQVSDTLDPAMVDLDSLRLGPVALGLHLVSRSGAARAAALLDLRPAQVALAGVHAVLDRTSGALSWTLDALEPRTWTPVQDPLVGLLPPNQTSPEGEGAVGF